MNVLVNNWYVILITVVAVVAIAGDVYAFMRLNPSEQKKKVQEWLLIAVIKAEKLLGGGTGQLKLRTVYDMFVEKFPWLVKIISFDEFSDMVDIALDKMRDLIKNNSKVANYIAGTNETTIEQLIEVLANYTK